MASLKQRRGGAQAENHERWLLTYADLITLLLVFFIVLYAMSQADAQRFQQVSASLQRAFKVPVLEGGSPSALHGEDGAGGGSVLDEIGVIRRDLAVALHAQELPEGLSAETTPEGVLIRLANNIIFPSGRADVNGEAYAVLDAVAAVVQRQPNDIRVEGHTDNIPINTVLYPSNWELSAARALAVTHVLIERGGITPERISVTGYGEYRPLTHNVTREARALNRRTDILLLRR